MIRKWLKFNSFFIDILKNASASKTPESKWISDFSCKRLSSSYSLYSGSASSSVTSVPSAGNVNKHIRMLRARSDQDDCRSFSSDSEETEKAVKKSPSSTELFEVKGPNGSAFLIEVSSGDLDEVRNELIRLKGDAFHFDKTVIGWFIMKCILAAEPFPNSKTEQKRLAKIHAISSGSEEVYEGNGRFFFVNALGRTMRAKRILEKFGYRISGILYRFQPKEKINLDAEVREVCNRFMKAVGRIPKVISITHNL